MGLLLDFAYFLACLLLSPWILYRLVLAPGRRDFAMRFGVGLGERLDGSIWLHGSSAGEVTLLRPLVALLERDLPGTALVISAFTATGLAAARKLYSRHRVVQFPLDLSWVVRRFLRHFDPRLVIIVESEFWPNFIRCAHRQGRTVVVVNGKMSAKSYRVHARTRLIPRVLAELDLLAVQTRGARGAAALARCARGSHSRHGQHEVRPHAAAGRRRAGCRAAPHSWLCQRRRRDHRRQSRTSRRMKHCSTRSPRRAR